MSVMSTSEYSIKNDSITHYKCGKTSHNPNDVKNRYCGHCHIFLEKIKKERMRTRIISAFPGTGKTRYQKEHPETCLDSDSSLFSWIEVGGVKTRNPDFPNNYIAHIKENIGKYEIILVSSHDVVRDALLDNCLFFYLIYPDSYSKEEYLKRYVDRGNDDAFVKLLTDNWDKWLKELTFCEVG